jgi:PBSX family phage terminase large subunit
MGAVAKRSIGGAQAFAFKEFSRKQQKLLTWWKTGSPYADWDMIICDGSVRAGKTIAMLVSFILWAVETFVHQDKPVNLILAGRTMNALKRNVLEPLWKILAALGIAYRYDRQQHSIEIGCVTIYCFGASTEASQDTLQGLTAAGALLDEAALLPENFVSQAIARCSEEESKIWMNCNPEGPYHFLKVDYIDKAKEKRILHLHFTMSDNLTMSQKARDRYARTFSGLWYKRYILGLWVAAEGAIYDMFDPERHVVNTLPNMLRFWVASDYGTTNPTVFLLLGEGTDHKLYVCREWRWESKAENRQKTDKEYSADLRACLDQWGAELLPPAFFGQAAPQLAPERIWVDPSAASFIVQLYNDSKADARLRAVAKADNEVLDGIRNVATLLNMGLLLIHASCIGLCKEMTAYLWDSDYAEEHGEERPIKQNDHGPDALRYGVNGTRTVWLRWIRKQNAA